MHLFCFCAAAISCFALSQSERIAHYTLARFAAAADTEEKKLDAASFLFRKLDLPADGGMEPAPPAGANQPGGMEPAPLAGANQPDGILSKAEWGAADKNKDGYIDQTDFIQLLGEGSDQTQGIWSTVKAKFPNELSDKIAKASWMAEFDNLQKTTISGTSVQGISVTDLKNWMYPK